jgi:diguanylate cyclase (GGDEF)-like protein
MELLLWRWSTAVQLSSLVTIAVFFFALSRSVRLDEVRSWARAWSCNLAALAVTLAYWYVQPGPELFAPTRVLYAVAKTSFVLLLLQGAWSLKHPGARLLSRRTILVGLAAHGAVVAVVLPTIELLGLVQHVVMGALLLVGAVVLERAPRRPGLVWLSAGLLIRALLCLAEAAAYALQIAAPGSSAAGPAAWFLAASSSFDSGAEWLLALGCVIALSERVQRELRQANQGLLAAQEDLRRLADRDPLTALANRRHLPEALRAVQPQGALLLFFDLDEFKQINDRYGHPMGDECLKRFAAALGECFRPGDTLVRYAGDEFLVVAAGLDEASAHERVERVRERLRFATGGGPQVLFSVGMATLPPGGHPDDALRAADESMYAAKAARPARKAIGRRA